MTLATSRAVLFKVSASVLLAAGVASGSAINYGARQVSSSAGIALTGALGTANSGSNGSRRRSNSSD